ncbi:signal peptidase [Arthrobacter sp. UYNi723]
MSAVTEIPTAARSAAQVTELSQRPRTPRGSAGTFISARAASRVKTGFRRGANVLTTTMLVVAVSAFLFLAVGPRALGYQTSTMLTGSMSPLIHAGDVVVTVPTAVGEIVVGDVITYLIPVENHRVETHRVTQILTNADGTTAVRTKGDANKGVDPWTATLNGATVDRHVLTVPYVGQVIRTLRQPVVLNTLMYGAPAVLVIGLLASIWRKDPEPAVSG